MNQDTGVLTRDRLVTAGWASMGNAIVSMVPLVLLYSFGIEDGKVMGNLITAGLTLLNLMLTVFLLRTLRQLLNLRLRFHGVDGYVSILIWGNVVISGFFLLSLELAGMEEASTIGNVAFFVFFGVISIVFAMKLFRLNDSLFGLLKNYCYTTLAMGICFTVIFLTPLGVILGAASDVILGTIFFRASEQPESSAI